MYLYSQCVCNCDFTVCTDGTEEYDSEGSDSDEDENLEGPANGIYGEDSDDDDESDDSDEADGFSHRSSVIIEEVHDVEHDGMHITSATAAKVFAQRRAAFSVASPHHTVCFCLWLQYHTVCTLLVKTGH